MTEEELMKYEDSQDPFWDYVEEQSKNLEITADYFIEEFLVA
jgi:hypothetical protein